MTALTRSLLLFTGLLVAADAGLVVADPPTTSPATTRTMWQVGPNWAATRPSAELRGSLSAEAQAYLEKLLTVQSGPWRGHPELPPGSPAATEELITKGLLFSVADEGFLLPTDD